METAEPGCLIAGRYRLGSVVGRGGMGVVWQARDELLSRAVAVKELVWPAYFSETERAAACRRAVREARVTARLTHRNVIRVYDIIEENGCPWIVMEFLPYGSLRDRVREQGPLSPAEAAEAGLGILAALRAAHAQGIVHRDVKPANILLAPDRAVLTDFGVARSAGSSVVTTVGLLVGSPSYIAPERARGGDSGPAGDLWGLGASLYAAVEGHGPFDREGGALASLTAVVADEPSPSGNAGPLLWPVISGLLRKDPEKRLDAATAEEMLRRVGAAAPGPARMAATPAPARMAAPRPRRPAAVLAGSAAAAVLAAAGITAGLALSGSPGQATAAGATAHPPAAGQHAPAGTRSPADTATRPPAANARPAPPAGVFVAGHTSRADAAKRPSRGSAATTETVGAGPSRAGVHGTPRLLPPPGHGGGVRKPVRGAPDPVGQPSAPASQPSQASQSPGPGQPSQGGPSPSPAPTTPAPTQTAPAATATPTASS